jgi:integrase
VKHCQARNLTAGTVRSNRQAVDALLEAVGDVWVDKIEHQHLDKVFAIHTWQTSTRNQRLGQFKQFFKWCRARGLMRPNSDPLFGWRNEKVPVTPRLLIPRSEWGRLFAACGHPQETMLVATGLFLFLRGSEQRLLQLKHVHLDKGEIQVYRTKTKEHDVMPISSELAEHLREHLRYLAAEHGSDPNFYLIPKRANNNRGPNGKYVPCHGIVPTKPVHLPHLALQRVYARAGYPTMREGEHTLRRSGARAYFDSLVDQGYDGALRRVQSMLGHAHSAMTERYLGLDLDRASRNADLRLKPMFPTAGENVVQLRKA